MVRAVSYLLAVLAIWLIWQIADHWLAFPKWVWYCVAAALGVGAKLLLDGWDQWYLGIGLGGAVVLLFALSDLILVTTDLAKVAVLRPRGR